MLLIYQLNNINEQIKKGHNDPFLFLFFSCKISMITNLCLVVRQV